eukprot:scaffold1000_cov134-Skeletonema_menzelii.AAC.1
MKRRKPPGLSLGSSRFWRQNPPYGYGGTFACSTQNSSSPRSESNKQQHRVGKHHGGDFSGSSRADTSLTSTASRPKKVEEQF